MNTPQFHERPGFRVAPEERPWRTRRAARVVLVTPDDGSAGDGAQREVLLLADSDPGLSGVRWWVTPGGGIDGEESPAQAAVREIHEETGLVTEVTALRGPVAHRVVRHGYSDQVLEQEEWFFVLTAARFTTSTAGYTQDEQLTFKGVRWWPLAELADTREWIWPTDLPHLVALADRPDAWPHEYGLITDESTVPVADAGRPARPW